MEISDILAAAARDVESARLPEELREAAFVKAVELRSGGLAGGPAETLADGPSGQLAAVAEKLRVDPETVSQVVEITSEGVEIIVSPSLLPRQKAAATRDVALLVTATRQAAGFDEGWTDTELIREQCRNLGVFDSANFATEVAHLGAFLNFKGSGRTRKVRANLRGFEQAGMRMRELAHS
jgi:hypothetical protein